MVARKNAQADVNNGTVLNQLKMIYARDSILMALNHIRPSLATHYHQQVSLTIINQRTISDNVVD